MSSPTRQTTTLLVSGYSITVSEGHDGLPTALQSDLRADLPSPPSDEDQLWVAATHALEAVILGHAAAGVDINSDEYHAGLVVALEAVANYCT